MTLRLTQRAENDLTDIWLYVAGESSPETATRLVRSLNDACRHLLEFPEAGPSRDRLAAGLRVTFHRRYAVYYRASAAELIVVRVLHGARDIGAIAASGEFS